MERIITVVKRAHERPFKLKSQFARDYTHEVATAASLGWISTINFGETVVFSDRWSVTRAGLKRLELLEKDDNEH